MPKPLLRHPLRRRLPEQEKLDDLQWQVKQFHLTEYKVEQILGKALGCPQYPEEWGAGEDVCTAEHTPETLAVTAAQKIADLQAEITALRKKVRLQPLAEGVSDTPCQADIQGKASYLVVWASPRGFANEGIYIYGPLDSVVTHGYAYYSGPNSIFTVLARLNTFVAARKEAERRATLDVNSYWQDPRSTTYSIGVKPLS